MQSHHATGKLGEKIAALYLKCKGYQIVCTNFRCKSGEIDIVTKNKDKYSFVEVKCRVGTTHGNPYEAVTYSKRRKLYSAIQFYMLQNNLYQSKLSAEVISIVLNPDRSISSIKHFSDLDMVI
jgi:putative endonuclease